MRNSVQHFMGSSVVELVNIFTRCMTIESGAHDLHRVTPGIAKLEGVGFCTSDVSFKLLFSYRMFSRVTSGALFSCLVGAGNMEA